MVLKKARPMTPGMRQLVRVDRSGLHKGRPEKTLTHGLSKRAGRDNHGHISVRRRGGGHKRLYRTVDFRRTRFDEVAVVQRIEYDPNRTAFIALIRYADGSPSYILAPQHLLPGDKVMSGKKTDFRPGNAMPLSAIPIGSIVHNVEMKPGGGGKMARAAGTSVQLAGRDSGYAQLKLASGEFRIVRSECMATIGVVSNPDQKNIKLSKAGRSRHLGRRPKVRGVVMNPVDHPHGGGEGKTSGGRHPVSPWGKPTKGKRTRHNKSTQKYIIRRRAP